MEVAPRVFMRNYLFLLAIVIIGLFLRVYGLGAADYYLMSWENTNTSENIKELQSDVNSYIVFGLCLLPGREVLSP
jgi:uncharacterized membrane protein